MSTKRPVIVMELPQQLKRAGARAFQNELQEILQSDRPCVVLDCSQVQQMDSAGVEMLLRCLEEAMKRDGDLKLAAISPASAVILELMRVDRLFEVFETTEQAMESFQTPASLASLQTQPWYSGVYGISDLKPAV
jgi:anti-sigma B factor antagonist